MKKIITLLLWIVPLAAVAHDGDHCQNPFFQNQQGITTGIQGFAGQYKTGADQFDYFVTGIEAGYSYKNRFQSAVQVPFVALENNQDTEFLLSDVQILLQGSLLTWDETNFFSLGLNTELPTGDEDKLVGGGHMHFRPYLGFQQNMGSLTTYGQTGFVVAAKNHDEGTPEDHHNETSEIHGSVVDVHSSREATFQLGTVVPVIHQLYFNFSLAGQVVLTDINANVGDFYMSANPAITLTLTENSNFTMFSQIPVTSLQRFDYRLGAGINYIF